MSSCTCHHIVLPWKVSQQRWLVRDLLHIEPGIENCQQGMIPKIKETFICYQNKKCRKHSEMTTTINLE